MQNREKRTEVENKVKVSISLMKVQIQEEEEEDQIQPPQHNRIIMLSKREKGSERENVNTKAE